jgi:hypothetical protein
MSTIVPFGKYKGLAIENINDLRYIIWLAGYRLFYTKIEKAYGSAVKYVDEKQPQIRKAALEYLERKCWHCGKKLVPIGHKRINGASHDDWKTRKFHKECWLELKKEEEDN